MTVSRSERSVKAREEEATATVWIVPSQNIWCYMCGINVIHLTNIPSDTLGYLLRVILTCDSVFPENSRKFQNFPTWLSSRTRAAWGYNLFLFFSFFLRLKLFFANFEICLKTFETHHYWRPLFNISKINWTNWPLLGGGWAKSISQSIFWYEHSEI